MRPHCPEMPGQSLEGTCVTALPNRAAAAQNVGMTLKILLVDDDPDVREMLGLAVKSAGMDVEILEAANGLDALVVARDYKPDVVVLDLDMPVMDGRIAGHALRGVLPRPRVLAFSSLLDRDGSARDWADGYFEKVELDRLLDALLTGAAA